MIRVVRKNNDEKNYDYIQLIQSDSQKDKILISNGKNTIKVPYVAKTIFTQLKSGKTPEDVSVYLKKNKGIDIDVGKFIDDLNKINFLKNKRTPVNNTSYAIGKVFNKIIDSVSFRIMITVLFIFELFLISKFSFGYFFDYNYTFVFKNTALSIIFYFVLSWISVVFHELAHYYSASGYKLHATFNLGTRLQFLVAQTVMDNPYSLPKKKRISIYLSGIISDLFVCEICFLVIILSRFILVVNIARCLLFIKVSAIIWQFLFYMKTDMYYVFSDLVGETNLMSQAENYLKDKSKTVSNIVKFYSIFLVIGRLVTISYFIFLELPIIFISVNKIFHITNLFNYIVSMFIFTFNWGVFLIVFIKNNLKKLLKNN